MQCLFRLFAVGLVLRMNDDQIRRNKTIMHGKNFSRCEVLGNDFLSNDRLFFIANIHVTEDRRIVSIQFQGAVSEMVDDLAVGHLHGGFIKIDKNEVVLPFSAR